MAERDKGIDKRLTLTITNLLPPKDIGKDHPLVKYSFLATGEDKEYQYQTFSKTFGEYLEGLGPGRTLDCDVNVSTREVQGNTYTDRMVRQIYIDGAPLKTRRPGAGASPEQIASEEERTAFRGFVRLMAEGVIKKDDLDGQAVMEWGRKRLGIGALDATSGSRRAKSAPPKREPEEGLPEEKPAENHTGFTTEDLLHKVAVAKGFRDYKTAREWLIQAKGFKNEKINNDPKGVFEKVKAALNIR
jgi:hypothetical protein